MAWHSLFLNDGSWVHTGTTTPMGPTSQSLSKKEKPVTGNSRLPINSPNLTKKNKKKPHLPFTSLVVFHSLCLSPHHTEEGDSGRNTQMTQPAMATFSKERENFVYVAKLAEQAERYDGSLSLSLSRFSLWSEHSFWFLHFSCIPLSITFQHLLQQPIFSFSL